MYKFNLKSIWTLVFMSMTLLISAQEICNNAIDDDGDMLVDLNDDECICSDVLPLTSVTGSICRHNLKLTLEEVPTATTYQWYKDGIALLGEDNSTITLSDLIADVEGSYEVVATTPTGCSISEAHDVVIPLYEVYLGEEHICDGDTIFFGPFSLTEEGFFRYKTTTKSDGCDSIVTLDVYVTQDAAYEFFETHCEGTCVPFGSQTICDSGTFEESFPSVAGCDSLVRKHFTFAPLDPIVLEETICEGENYAFKDISESSPGIYETTCTGAEGCDTVYVIELMVIEPVETTVEEYFCAGGSFDYNGETYTESGTHIHTFAAATGCDSIVTLNLMELPEEEYSKEETICKGKTFIYGDITATESGVYTTLIETGPCDSLVTVTLEVIDPSPALEEATICDGEVFTWFGTDYDAEGEYDHTEVTNGDCDILHRLALTVIEEKVEMLSEEICSGGFIIVGGMTFDGPGDFEIPLAAQSGCDSLIMLNVVQLEAERYPPVKASICQGLTFYFKDIVATESGEYETLVETEGECDSIIIVDLTVVPPSPVGESMTICQGLSFDWYGTEYTESGTYEYLLEVDGECDDLFQLDLVVTAPEVVSEELVLCPSEIPYYFEDLKIEEEGFYTTTVSAEGECDIKYDFDVELLYDSAHSIDADICDGEAYTDYGLNMTVSGTEIVIIPNAVGCDSTITVNVLAHQIGPATPESAMICPGDIFLFHGEEITDEGDHTTILHNQYGCDSLVTLTLAFNSLLEFDETYVRCQGDPLVAYGMTFDETGTHEVMLSSGSGCDSLITIDLTVNPNTNEEIDAMICKGETFMMDGIVATETDTYIARIANKAGCDSTIIVNLTVVSHDETEVPMEICEGDTYEFGGQIYDAEGIYPTSFLSKEGCDSTVNLDLKILPLGERVEEVMICPGDEYVYNDIFATEAGTYQTTISNAVGCDSVITIMLGLDDIDTALDLGEDKLINIGASVDIIPEYISGALNGFEWYDENGEVIGNNQELLSYSPLEDTYVELFAFNENGCEVRERIDIDVELIVDIYIPNVISVVEEGANNHFTPGANESVIGIEELYIYDRWGELMFTDDHEGNLDSYLGWDGVFKNKTALGGVYTYLIFFEIIDGSTVKKAGSFTLLD